MPQPLHIEKGQRFGEWTVESEAPRVGRRRSRAWNCLCDCGQGRVVRQEHLVHGASRSCGHTVRSHGQSFVDGKPTAEYVAWKNMKARCDNPNAENYADYGGRGIQYEPEWSDFHAFFLDVGPRPSPEHTLDRKDNDVGYFRGNVRWATNVEQQRNKRRTLMLTVDGATKSVRQWADERGLDPKLVAARMRAGATGSIALGRGPIGIRPIGRPRGS